MTSYISITLDSQNPVFPTDNTLLNDKADRIVMSNIRCKNNAVGYIMIAYVDRFERYLIEEHMDIPLELSIIGFHFILDNPNSGQELKFDYQLFL